MDKAEALEKIAELQRFIEELDKPKQIRAYIKLNAEGNNKVYGWNSQMTKMIGGVFDVYDKSSCGARIYVDDNHSDWYNFDHDAFVIVEGSLD